MKTCKTCGETKPLEQFYRAPTNKDGLQGSCKSCHAKKHVTPEKFQKWADHTARTYR